MNIGATSMFVPGTIRDHDAGARLRYGQVSVFAGVGNTLLD